MLGLTFLQQLLQHWALAVQAASFALHDCAWAAAGATKDPTTGKAIIEPMPIFLITPLRNMPTNLYIGALSISRSFFSSSSASQTMSSLPTCLPMSYTEFLPSHTCQKSADVSFKQKALFSRRS